MIVYAADDEQLLLDILCDAILASSPGAELHSFTRPSQLLAELSSGGAVPDVCFLDIEMPGVTGLELAQLIKQKAPKTNIVFVTGYSQYAQEAYSVRPSGYVMKPATKEKIAAELDNLRNPPPRTVPGKKVRIQCFGDFEVFVDGAPVTFSRTKSKEMLAYLVDRRGTKCSAQAIASVIWDDGVYDTARQKLLSIVRADLIKSLKKAGAGSIIQNDRTGIAVVPAQFDCDYYMALSGDMVCVNSFLGEYMAAYSWAEFTAASLTDALLKA